MKIWSHLKSKAKSKIDHSFNIKKEQKEALNLNQTVFKSEEMLFLNKN